MDPKVVLETITDSEVKAVVGADVTDCEGSDEDVIELLSVDITETVDMDDTDTSAEAEDKSEGGRDAVIDDVMVGEKVALLDGVALLVRV